MRLRHANEDFLRASNLFQAKPPVISQVELDRATDEFLRVSNLFQAKLASQLEYDRAKTAKESAEAQLKQAK